MICYIAMLASELEGTLLFKLQSEIQEKYPWQIQIDIYESEEQLNRKIESEEGYVAVTFHEGQQKGSVYLKKEAGEKDSLSYVKNQIVYIEVYGHRLEFHMRDGNIKRQTGSLKSCMIQLSKSQFVQVHKSYLINIADIECIENGKVILKNQEILPLSKHRKKEVKEKYNKYYR